MDTTAARPTGTQNSLPNGLPDNLLAPVPGLLWAFRFGGDGAAEPLDPEQPIDADRGLLWLHLNLGDTLALDWIVQADLPPQAKAVFAKHSTHQQLHAADGAISGVVSDLARGLEGTGDTICHLYFAMSERLLISGRHHPLTSASNAREALESGRARIDSVAALFELIVDNLAEGVDRFLDTLNTELDTVEDGLTRGQRPDARMELGRVRRSCVRMHRELSGLRLVLWRLERDNIATLPIGVGKLKQRLDALDRDVVDLRDRARLLQEEIAAATAEESNRALGILSIITAVFLPPTLITGLFGVNVKGLPWAESENGVLYVCITMVLSVAVVLFLLRRIGVMRPGDPR